MSPEEFIKAYSDATAGEWKIGEPPGVVVGTVLGHASVKPFYAFYGGNPVAESMRERDQKFLIIAHELAPLLHSLWVHSTALVKAHKFGTVTTAHFRAVEKPIEELWELKSKCI